MAERGGRLVGTVTLTPYGVALPTPGPASWSSATSGSPGPPGAPGGRALVAACEQAAIETGDTALVLSVIASNEVGKRLYRRLGFSPDPARPRAGPGVRLTFWSRPVGG